MRIHMQEVTAPPSRRSVAFAGTGRRLVCWRCNAGSGCLLDVVGWDLWGWTRWSRRNENRIFRACGSYGEMACLWGICRGYGRMAGLWGSAKTYGEIRQACGRMGEPRKRMGNATGYGNLHRHMGGRQAVWGAKNLIKTGTIGTVGGLWTLQILINF